MTTLESFISLTQSSETEDDLYRALSVFLKSYGINYFAYFIIAQQLRAMPPHMGLVTHTYPRGFSQLYLKNNYVEFDPIIQQCLTESRPFHWHEVAKKRPLNEQQKQMLKDYKVFGFVDGIAVPVFGPMGTIAVFSLATLSATLDLSDSQLQTLQFACVQVHNRYFDIAKIGSDAPTKRLSPREREALALVADGLASPAIAERLGISENTVDTMLRRIFAKLNVNNRISAVLKAIGLGLILP